MYNEEFGFDPEEAKIATDQLRQPIQGMLGDFTLQVVLAALAEGFLGCLKTAGASETDCQLWAQKLLTLNGRKARRSIERGYREVGEPITRLIQTEGIHPLAVAYSLTGAMASIVRQLDGISTAQADEFANDLIRHINHVRAQGRAR